LLDLMMPEMDGFQFLMKFISAQTGAQFRSLWLRPRSLSPEDRQRLNGSVEKILQKGRTVGRSCCVRSVTW
jgi:CheY-like chemotaxis protein